MRKLNKETGEMEPVFTEKNIYDGLNVPNIGIFFKTPFNHDTNAESDRTGLACADPSLTKQEFKEDADINNIIARFQQTNELPPIPLPEHFMDIRNRQTYLQVQEHMAEANAIFYKLPAQLRAEHLNDPARWADAVVKAVEAGDLEKARKLGIDEPEPKPFVKPKETASGGTPAPAPSKGAPGAPKAPDGAQSETE